MRSSSCRMCLVLSLIFLMQASKPCPAPALAPESFTRERDEGRARIRAHAMAAQGGVIILTRIGGPLLPDPKNRLATPKQRFSDRARVIQQVRYDSAIPQSFLEFVVLEKKEPGQASPEKPDPRIRQDAEKIALLLRKYGVPKRDRFDVHRSFGSGLRPNPEGEQLTLIQYAGFYFLKPIYYVPLTPLEGGGVRGEKLRVGEDAPLFVLTAKPGQVELLHRAMTDYSNKVELDFWELDRTREEELRKILYQAPEDQVWVSPIRPPNEPLPDSSWPAEVKNHGYRRDKEDVDRQILETYDALLAGKSPEDLKKIRIVDLGAGDGTLLEKIQARFPGVEASHLYAYEKNETHCDILRKKGYNVIGGDIAALPFRDGMFDYVIVESVFAQGVIAESDEDKVMQEIFRITRGPARKGIEEALKEEISSTMEDLRKIYNARVPMEMKEPLPNQLHWHARDHVPDSGPGNALKETEADLALFCSGYLDQTELQGINRLREFLNTHHPLSLAAQIFFVPPSTRTELFWHGQEFASGSTDAAGKRIYLPIAFALKDLRLFPMAGVTPESSIPQHYFKTAMMLKRELRRVASGRYDKSLDAELQAVAERDKNRPSSDLLPMTPGDPASRNSMEISDFFHPDEVLKDLPSLYREIREAGWKAAALPVRNLPEDIASWLKDLTLEIQGKRFSFSNLMEAFLDGVVFAPNMMAYGPHGQKVAFHLASIAPLPDEGLAEELGVGKRLVFVCVLNQSDALKSGQEIYFQPKEALVHEMMRALMRSALVQMTTTGSLPRMYLEPPMQERAVHVLEKKFLDSYSMHLHNRSSFPLGVPDLLEQELQRRLAATEFKLRSFNAQLNLPSDFQDFTREISSAILTALDTASRQVAPREDGEKSEIQVQESS